VEPLALFSSDKFSGSDVKVHRVLKAGAACPYWVTDGDRRGQVAASGVYTAYTLAGGRIRAQTVATGSRVLLQAHDAPVTDLKVSSNTLLPTCGSGKRCISETLLRCLQFSKHNAAVLASAAGDGTVLIHKLHQVRMEVLLTPSSIQRAGDCTLSA
jgi:hypothetical protein